MSDGVLSVTINRPDSLNSLTTPVITGIADTMERAATDPRVKVVRLGGAGRGFCSGAGISADDMSGSGGVSPDAIVLEINRLIRAITALPHPVVAVVQGPAAGVGVSLALACDVVLASDKAFFMLAFTKIGLMPDGGASALVAAAVGRHPGDANGAAAGAVAGRPRRCPGDWSARCIRADDFDGRGGQGDREVGGGPRGGVRQDQGRDQCGHARPSWMPALRA